MIAKVITKGRDRAEAIAHMGTALDAFRIRGVQHNIPFLAALVAHPRFVEGRLTPDFIEEEFPDGFSGRAPDDETRLRLLAVAAMVHHRITERGRRISGQAPVGCTAASAPARTAWTVRHDRSNVVATVTAAEDGHLVAIDGGARHIVAHWDIGDPLFDGTVEGRRMVVRSEEHTSE